MTNELHCPKCGHLVLFGEVYTLGLAMIAHCPSCGHEWGINSQWGKVDEKLPPGPAIVTLDPDGDAWLKTTRGRRQLTQAEFLELTKTRQVLVFSK